ncbi:MAG: histidinol-phosphate transaminase [Gammaproteobacteria bacterium]
MNKMLNRRKFLFGGATLAGAGVLDSIPGAPSIRLLNSAIAQVKRPSHIIRASSNENPYGPSRVALKAVHRAMEDANKYGGITQQLISLMSKIENVPEDHITVGTGSGEILNVSAMIASLEGGSIVAPYPTFESLPRYAGNMGSEIIRVPVDDKMHIDLNAMYAAIRPDTKMVYLCNPNNPIPSIIEKNAMRDFIDEVSKDRLVFVDEAYYEYVDNPDFETMMDYVRNDNPNVIVARTASKIHGIAALRVGFGYAHPDLIASMDMKKTGSLNIVGQHAAYASYQDMEFQNFARKMNKESLSIVEGFCDEMGINYVKSNANFGFIETGMEIEKFSAAMLNEGIMVGRAFPPFTTWARVSMQRPEDMEYFTQTYRKLFG